MNRVAQYRAQDEAACWALTGAVGLTVAVGVLARLTGVADPTAAAALAGAALGWLVLVGLRREARIRRRLADPRTRACPAIAPLPDPLPDPSPVVAAGRPHTPTGGAA